MKKPNPPSTKPLGGGGGNKQKHPYTHFSSLLFLTAAGLSSLFWHWHCCSFLPHLSTFTPVQIHGKPKTKSILIGERGLQSTGVFLILTAFMHVAGRQSLLWPPAVSHGLAGGWAVPLLHSSTRGPTSTAGHIPAVLQQELQTNAA